MVLVSVTKGKHIGLWTLLLCTILCATNKVYADEPVITKSVRLPAVVVKPQQKAKYKYNRKDNPAVAFMEQVIAHKDSMTVQTMPYYTVNEYSRTSFALNDFNPNFEKGFWKGYECVRKYIDSTNVARPSLTLSMRESLMRQYFQRDPKREKTVVERKRKYGVEDMFTTQALSNTMDQVFKPIDINDDDITLLFNRFVSPLSSTLADAYYHFYLLDTVEIDGDICQEVAFVPVNKESYAFSGSLFVLNDGSYKVKEYTLHLPQLFTVNFVDEVKISHTYRRLSNGLWANNRTNIVTDFFVFNRKKNLTGRHTLIYEDYDFEPIDDEVFAFSLVSDSVGRKDTLTFNQRMALWDSIRPEPLSKYEVAILDLLEECKHLPRFNSLIMFCDAISSRYVATTPSYRWGESKWDFGPIYNMLSWNILEGVRFRLGGMTTGRTNPHWFFKGYAAFSTNDLLPKGNATVIYSFDKKKYQPYEPWRHYISVMAQYDVEEPGAAIGWLGRDNIFSSIPLMKPKMKNFQYVARARAEYMKEWPSHFSIKARFDFENNKAAGSLSYDRITAYQADGQIAATQHVEAYNNYQGEVEILYMPGGSFPVSREGVDTRFTLEKDGPVVSLTHKMGYLDDRPTGGQGFYYNHTEIGVAKRFWFSSFGHLDTRLQVGYIWNQVPFMKLYSPATASNFILNDNGFNAMQPMEFMMDRYLDWSMTYYFKGWIFNRIPGINRLQLRGLVSFSGVYGYLGKRNNPYLEGNVGLYQFSDNSQWTENNDYIEGYTSSPIGKLPYMELTVGLENILKVVRIDYVRRLTYNEYTLPSGMTRKYGAWGRNGVKISFRFEL